MRIYCPTCGEPITFTVHIRWVRLAGPGHIAVDFDSAYIEHECPSPTAPQQNW